MQKEEKQHNVGKIVMLTILGVFIFFFVVLPLGFAFFIASLSSGSSFSKGGNIALIPLEGVITTNGAQYFGQSTISSKTIVEFIEDAAADDSIAAIVLEINSPGGSAVASDEIASAVKNTEKPVVAFIREVGASGGYWIASAADDVIAHKMAITGSIGVISSYLEFSGLMEQYGVGYERLVAGKYKDIGTPLKDLRPDERRILQEKLDTIHRFFIEEIARNRELSLEEVQKAATGEFYLGVEALELGLVDVLGDKKTVEMLLQEKYGITNPEYVVYQRQAGFFDLLAGVVQEMFFHVGKGIGSVFVPQQQYVLFT